ncbi:hypothetical protein PYH37_002924 [Sinorhizobium numidicum]|uniref:Uncharacterized protein n=1 Tax=Sinorhizobium numidicum TaxID=680248 RepID=A0ABY8D6R1_9HYPH|nr:hypothetical protein [Sinorhizobium numidicum]WEX78074.1 hypothetical protein PYH37_002924 [Sinorhizobium numidicum]WEX84733.1 hypothetical protein PYH38_003637 [Sinorhizobium numidicum]
MDMMAMAYMFDLLSKNRPWDEAFEPRPPSRTERLATRLLSTVIRKRRPVETCRDYESTRTASCEGGIK